jgi:hypothetical protein
MSLLLLFNGPLVIPPIAFTVESAGESSSAGTISVPSSQTQDSGVIFRRVKRAKVAPITVAIESSAESTSESRVRAARPRVALTVASETLADDAWAVLMVSEPIVVDTVLEEPITAAPATAPRAIAPLVALEVPPSVAVPVESQARATAPATSPTTDPIPEIIVAPVPRAVLSIASHSDTQSDVRGTFTPPLPFDPPVAWTPDADLVPDDDLELYALAYQLLTR